MIFVGRQKELETLDSLLLREEAGLITLWGPGGVGKTTLARRATTGGASKRWMWIDLASARTEKDVASAFAIVLAVSLLTTDDDSPALTLTLTRAAAAQNASFVADNAEQLDPQARALIATISQHARVLVTSREAFGVENEHAIAIEPLQDADALALFMSLTSSPEADAIVVQEIVRRLDALPLAIELAAARAPLLGVKELLSRLDRKIDVLADPAGNPQRPARHATLRAAIAWSWDLLEESDRRVLVRCAMFEAPFDALLVERALDGVVDDVSVLDALARLQQRALLHSTTTLQERPQMHLLEAVRDFVREHTNDDDRAAHARAILERTEPLAAIVKRGGAVSPELAARRADLFRAVTTTTTTKTKAKAKATTTRLKLVLASLLMVTGPLDALLREDKAESEAESEEDAELQIARGSALRAMGRYVEAEEIAAAVLAKNPESAEALRFAGVVARSRGDAKRAVEMLTQAKTQYERNAPNTDDAAALIGVTIGELGAAYQTLGDLARARQLHAEAIAIHVAEGSIRAEGVDRSYLAVATHRAGDPASAVALHEAALAIHRRSHHKRLEGAELLHLGFVHHQLGAPGAARTAFDAARHALASAGARGLEALAIVFTARLEADEGNDEAARTNLAIAAKLAPRGWPRLEAMQHLVRGHLALGGGGGTGGAASAITSYEASMKASSDVEVGFEALTPAYLALALARSSNTQQTAAVNEHLDQAKRLTQRVSNPHIKEALAILEAAALAQVLPAASAAGLSSSSEVRRALAFAGSRRGIVLSDEARRLVLPDGRTVDLSRRKNVRLILLTLAKARRDQPGKALTADTLIEAGWPGERMRAEAATKRLHTAIWTLRSLGLDDVLLSNADEDGGAYFIDPKLRLDLDPV